MTDTVHTGFALDEADRRTFQEQGFLTFKVLEEEEMVSAWRTERLALMDRSNAVYTEDWAVSGNTNISNYDRHLDNEFLADVITNPAITDRVASVLGPDVLCWRTEFFPKYPGDEGTDWHQADTFANASGKPQIVWPEDSGFGGTLTVWTAFTEATVDNGCLQFIPGSYTTMNYDETKVMEYRPDLINRNRKQGVRRGFFGYDYRDLQINPDFVPDESKAVPIVLRPGEAVMFWSTLMHASYPHAGRTDEMRLGFAGRYVPTSTHVYPDTDVVEEYGGKVSLERYGAVVVSGENRYSHNRIATHTTTGHPFSKH
ncbi:chlorinating enzyme [Streptomyces sp. NPDC093982]|jgi:non-heme Fe2+,alpha-ketoglutarate-dependent halogenase|uniref:chlorinating enzyme n=1 Tax=Streptomyces sp. NPDC093982 TaxID=3155077 RepID=UPI00342B8B87